MKIQAAIFDVFGTCVDWRSGVATVATRYFASRDIQVDPFEFADYWRSRYQPAMARIRSGARGYIALDDLHHENLLESLIHFDLQSKFNNNDTTEFARAWEQLPVWDDVVSGLEHIRKETLTAPCSNGSIALMAHLARFNHIHWDAILGADIASNYKPESDVYIACCNAFRLASASVIMVAAHNDDLHAARNAGLRTAFLPRLNEHGSGQTSDLAADEKWDIIASSFTDLAQQIADYNSQELT